MEARPTSGATEAVKDLVAPVVTTRTIDVDDKVYDYWQLWLKGLAYRSQFDGHWEDDRLTYLGHVWKEEEVRGTIRPSTNLTFAAVELRSHLLSEAMGKLEFIPRHPGATGIATLYQRIYDYLRDQSRYRIERFKAIKNICVYGTGWIKFDWDPRQKKVVASALDPQQVVISPGALAVSGSTYVAWCRNIPRAIAYAKWPQLKGKVQSGIFQDVVEIPAPQATSSDTPKLFTVEGGGGGVGVLRKGISVSSMNDDLVSFLQVYYRAVEEADKNVEGWRICNIVNDVIVSDEELMGIDAPPIVAYHLYPDTWGFYRPSMISFIRSIQAAANIRHAQLMDWVDKIVRPTVVKAEESAASLSVDERTGFRVINYKFQGGAPPPTILHPPDPPAALFSMLSLEKELFNDILGNQEIQQGKRPVGVQTGEAMKVLTENANARIRGEAASIAASDIECAWVMLKIARVFMGKQMMRLKMGVVELEQTKQSMQQLGGQMQPAGAGAAFIKTPEQLPPLDEIDVELSTTYLVPRDRSEKGNLMLELFKMNICDAEDLLIELDIPNRGEILQKFKERQQMMQEQAAKAQAMAAGMPSPGGGGQPAPGPGSVDLDQVGIDAMTE
jgi:hypothetical protein